MKTRFLALLCALCVVIMASMVACSSDDSPSAQAGNGGSGNAAGQGGAAGVSGNGGNGGSSAQAGNGGSSGTAGSAGDNGGWKKGVVGKANKGVIVLAKGAGQIQGFSVNNGQKTTGLQISTVNGVKSHAKAINFGGHLLNFDGGITMKPMDLPGDGGDSDADTDADAGLDASDDVVSDSNDEAEADAADADNGGVDTTPKVDLSQITPDFAEMWFPIPPYLDSSFQPSIRPYTAILKPDGTVTTVQHFQDWTNELALNCFTTYPSTVNGTPLHSYSGLSVDIADCLNRHFFISNAGKYVWELYSDGTKQILTPNDDLSGASSIICHPQGYLVVTTLPQYAKGNDSNPPEVGVKIKKVTLDGVVSDIASLPVGADYTTLQKFTPCFAFPFTTMGMPIGIRNPITLRSDGSYLVGDVGAKKIYAVSEDGVTTTVFSEMDLLTVSAILAPNDVIYKVDAPFIGTDETGVPFLLTGATIQGYDGTAWQDVLPLPGYDAYVNTMSSGQIKVPCPQKFASLTDSCYQPWGVFIKIGFGANANLYIMDPVKGEIVGVPLDMGGADDAGDTTDSAADAPTDDAESDASAD
jgi:hypothetical protein